jgi:hypothetical protein
VNDLSARLTAIEQSLQAGTTSGAADRAPGQTGAGQSAAATAAPAAASPAPASGQSDSTRLLVDLTAAERALERTLVQSGALLLPRGAVELVPGVASGIREFTFPEDVMLGAQIAAGLSSVERIDSVFNLAARFGLPFDSQIEIALPYRFVTQTSTVSVAGIPVLESRDRDRGAGDYSVGFAKTLLRESGSRPDIVGRIRWHSGAGDETDGTRLLGGGFQSWTGSLSFVKRRDPLALLTTVGYTSTRRSGAVEIGDEVSLSFGTAFAVSPDSSLFGSIIHRSIADTKIDNQTLPGSGLSATSLSLGLSTFLRRGALLNVYSEIGISSDAPDYSLGFDLPLRLR